LSLDLGLGAEEGNLSEPFFASTATSMRILASVYAGCSTFATSGAVSPVSQIHSISDEKR